MGILKTSKLKKMYKKTSPTKTSIAANTSYQGETIEQKINRIVNNKEPITDGAPLIYTDRSEGVQAEYDIRTDRFEIAVEAMDKVSRSHRAKREEKAGKVWNEKTEKWEKKQTDKKNDGGAEPTQGTDPGTGSSPTK